MSKKRDRCPTCQQDMNCPPRQGWRNAECPQCGQGLTKPRAQKLKAQIKEDKLKARTTVLSILACVLLFGALAGLALHTYNLTLEIEVEQLLLEKLKLEMQNNAR